MTESEFIRLGYYEKIRFIGEKVLGWEALKGNRSQFPAWKHLTGSKQRFDPFYDSACAKQVCEKVLQGWDLIEEGDLMRLVSGTKEITYHRRAMTQYERNFGICVLCLKALNLITE